MFQQLLYQLEIMQNYQNNLNQDAHVQLTGININQKYQRRHKIYIYFILSKFPRSEQNFCFTIRKYYRQSSTNSILVPKIEIGPYNSIIDGSNFIEKPIKHAIKIYENVKKKLLIKETITQLVVYQIILLSKKFQGDRNRFQ